MHTLTNSYSASYCVVVQLTGQLVFTRVTLIANTIGMVNVSKKLLSTQMLGKISDLLIVHILRMKTKRQARQLFYELLTPTERIQLAKRFASLTMLYRGHDAASIATTLNVSRTTVGNIEDKLEKGKYETTIEELKRASRGDLAVAVEKLIEFGFVKGGRTRLRYTKRALEERYANIPKERG